MFPDKEIKMKHMVRSMGETMANAYGDIYQRDYLSKMNFSADKKVLERVAQTLIRDMDNVRSPIARAAIKKAYDELTKAVGEM